MFSSVVVKSLSSCGVYCVPCTALQYFYVRDVGPRRLLHRSIAASMLLYAGNGFLRAHRHASRLTPCSLHVEVLELKRADGKLLGTVVMQNIALM